MNTTLICLIIPIAGLAIWWLCFHIRWPERKSDLQAYWEAFADEDGCKDALALYRDGIHIVNYYGIPLPEVGCPDEEVFHQAAVNALRRVIESESTRYMNLYNMCQDADSLLLTAREVSVLKKFLSPINDGLIKLRAQLATLKLLRASEDERLAAANTFVTI